MTGRAVQYEGKDADNRRRLLFVQIIWLICEGEPFDSTFSYKHSYMLMVSRRRKIISRDT
jgi:hypothetical protein